jgi:hypothetical protein
MKTLIKPKSEQFRKSKLEKKGQSLLKRYFIEILNEAYINLLLSLKLDQLSRSLPPRLKGSLPFLE